MLGTANDTNGGNVGTIEFTVGFPGIIDAIGPDWRKRRARATGHSTNR